MIDDEEYNRFSRKTYFTGGVIFMACAVVSYNMLFSQDTLSNRPGSTAVRVEVKDMDVAPSLETNISSIGKLVDETANGSKNSQYSALTSSIQTELGKLGYYKGSIDGQIGPQTRAAIMRYQRQVEIQANGDVSQSLLDHIRLTRKISESAGITGSIQPSGRANGYIPSKKPATLEPVRASIQVQMIQEKLAFFGYNPGKVDGLMGKATTNAIKQFERDRSLTVTGKITPMLKSELGL